MQALPATMKEVVKMPRAYIANVIHTILQKDFLDWTNERITFRNLKVASDKDMNIKMDKEIADIFKNSTSVSLSKGISGNLMRESAKVSHIVSLLYLF